MQRTMGDHQRALEQLSSGRRINRAADDAAGISITMKQSARIRSLHAAKNNASQIMDLAQVADAALDEVSSIVIRMRELAMTSANGVVDQTARAAIQTEFVHLRQEVDRIAKQTKYNGKRLITQAHMDVGFVIDSSASMGGEINQVINSIDSFFQGFTDANVDAQFGLADMNLAKGAQDGTLKVNDTNQAGFKAALQGLSLQGGAVDPYSSLVNAGGVNDFNNDGDDFSWRTGVERHLILLTDTRQEGHVIPGDPSQSEVATQLRDGGITVHSINPVGYDSYYSSLTSQTGGSLHDIGNASGSGIPAALDKISDELVGDLWPPVEEVVVQAGINDTADDNYDTGLPVDANATALGLRTLNLSTQQDAMDALDDLDTALQRVSISRAKVGAVTNRMEHTINYLLGAAHAETAARSRILDTDLASTTADLARSQILNDLSTALWGQVRQLRMDSVQQLLAGLGN